MNTKHVYNRSKKNPNTNYRREMKLIQINIGYYPLQFDELKFILDVHLHGWSVPNFRFFNVKPPI